jgi:sulfur-oxidizing protein SoxX
MKQISHILFIVILSFTLNASADDVAEGKKLAFDRKKGNCLACHQIDDGALAGNNGPILIAMKARYPNKQDLFDQIWDPTKDDPNSYMPPFGKHGIITKDEINKIIEYLYTL